MKRKDRLAVKIRQVQAQIRALRGNERVVTRLGGTTSASLGDEIVFQRQRLAVLRWALTATEVQIRARRAARAVDVGGDGVAAKYSVLRGLPDATMAKIAEMELLDIAVGEHPRLLRRRAPAAEPTLTPAEEAALLDESGDD
jgi:hypothetical protein